MDKISIQLLLIVLNDLFLVVVSIRVLCHFLSIDQKVVWLLMIIYVLRSPDTEVKPQLTPQKHLQGKNYNCYCG